MKINYNYISCIQSKKKPDIYIGGKINLPAKNYRFADINKKESSKKLEESDKNESEMREDEIKKDENYRNKNYNELSNQITDNMKKSKIYTNEKKEDSNNKIDLIKLEELEESKSFDDDVDQLRKKGQKYDSDAEGYF